MAKIVIAEDDVVARSLMVGVIESMGHMAIQCSNAPRAFGAVQSNPDAELLITNVALANLSDCELVRKIRDSCSNIPILIVSGETGPADVNNLMDAGASACLAQPVSAYSLKESIQENLSEA